VKGAAGGQPRASVIVPVHNGHETLGNCLAGLTCQTVAGLEIIVVDDGSTDGSAQIAQQYGAQVIVQPRQGAAAARNRGIAAAQGEIVLFTDADCRPQPDWAEHLLAAFGDPHVVASKGTYTSQQRKLVARFIQYEYEDRYRHTQRFSSIDFIDTYAAAYRRSALLAVGGFDEQFAAASVEDQELSFRMAAAGYRMVFVPEARVEHQHVDTISAYWRKKFTIGYQKPMVHQRHQRQLLHDSHTPASVRLQTAVALSTVLIVPWTLRSHRARQLATLAPAGILVSATPLTLRNLRKDATAGLLTPLLVLIRSFALASGFALGTLRLLFGL
jgi:GT2 family glycosyltransferase